MAEHHKVSNIIQEYQQAIERYKFVLQSYPDAEEAFGAFKSKSLKFSDCEASYLNSYHLSVTLNKTIMYNNEEIVIQHIPHVQKIISRKWNSFKNSYSYQFTNFFKKLKFNDMKRFIPGVIEFMRSNKVEINTDNLPLKVATKIKELIIFS